MTSSSQQSEISRRLTREATSHGPYLWSGADIENALLWFPPRPTRSAKQQDEQGEYYLDGEKTAKEGTAEEENRSNEASSLIETEVAASVATQEGNEFLRLLLHSRGIWNPRPSKKKKRSPPPNNTTNSNNSLTHDNATNKQRRKRKRNDSSNANAGGDNREGGTKRSSATFTTEVSSPLQSVLLGYYQLHVNPKVEATPSDSSLLDDRNNDNSEDNDTTTTTTAAVGAEAILEASTKLYNDLTTIISSRRHTHEIYQAVLSSSSCQPPQIQHEQNHKSFVNMSIKIDQYMVHPTTCARRVYASSIYDRLLHLTRTTSDTNYNNEEVEVASSSKEVQKFLQKLFGLATAKGENDGKIQEVILLVVLEPWRRLQVRQRQLKRNCEENQHKGDDLMETLFPLLTSKRVLPSAASTKSKSSDEKDDTIDDDDSSSPLNTLLVNFILQTNLDTWWSQPSPLLCIVSQYHFPIARKYIYYWFDRALVSHQNCYQDTSTSMEGFHNAVKRLQEFHRTSSRLRNLLVHFIQNIEEEIRMSSCRLRDGDEVEDESEVFQTSLALRAVKRALEE